jgi:hypothetical protein
MEEPFELLEEPRRFGGLRSERCPECGAEKVVIVSGVERREDDTLWVTWEEICENEGCRYDKVFSARFFPRYQGLEVERLG